MIWQIFVLLVGLGLISLIVSIVGKIRYSSKTALSAFSILIFSLTSSFVWNVEETVITTTDTIIHNPIFRSWEADTIAWILYIMFWISIIVFLINMFMTFQDYKYGKQNGRMNRRFDGNKDGLYD